MSSTLLQLKVKEIAAKQRRERDIIVLETTTLFNLHRVIQYCVQPHQGDSTVDGKAFTFHAGNKLIRAPKGAQLHRNSVYSGAEVGQRYTYESGNKKFMVEIIKKAYGDARYNVPRCISGKNGSTPADLVPTNKKLQVRVFTKARAGQRKGTQPVWCCPDDLSNEDVLNIHMAMMTKSIDD